jgi:hypothetical protein
MSLHPGLHRFTTFIGQGLTMQSFVYHLRFGMAPRSAFQ